ncbi:MAG: hypothetical protein LBR69_04525 [Endomicrobium sp.]|jgi:hypothetical protein|nr:hypothetical protein [Endomicrobium sp.]
MIKKLFTSLSMLIFFAGISFAGNIGNYVYVIYSDKAFPAAGADWDTSSVSPDAVGFDAQYFPGGVRTANDNPFEGAQYLNAAASNAGAFYLYFKTPQNMSAYMNGTIEFWVRSSTPNAGTLISLGYKEKHFSTGAETPRVKSIASLNPSFTSDGNWQKIILPVNGAAFGVADSVIEAGLSNNVVLPLLVEVSGAVTFDIDCIVWRKSPDTAASIGDYLYGVYSETVPGASPQASNANKISKRVYSGASADIRTGNAAFEGTEYIRSGPSEASWGFEFSSNSNRQDMSAYYNGSLEFNIRVLSGNASSIKAGITAKAQLMEKSLGGLGLAAGGNWQRVSIPLNSSGFSGLTSPSVLTATRFLFYFTGGGATVDIDNIVWKKAPPPANIGKDEYGAYSDTIEGAYETEIDWNEDKISKAFWDGGGSDYISNNTAYEGDNYLRTGTSGGWGYHFSDANAAGEIPRDMSAYYGGALEFYIRASADSANYSNVKIGINSAGLQNASASDENRAKTLGELGYVPNGQWQRISIPLNSGGFSGLTSAAMLSSTTYLFIAQNYGSDRIDIDHIVWRKKQSEPYGNKSNSVYSVYSDWLSGTGAQFDAGGVDSAALFPWSDGSGPAESADGTAFEGGNYLKSPANGGWGIFFTEGGQAKARSMSEFYNGTLEFRVRSAGLNGVSAGIKSNGTEYVTADLESFAAESNGGWQKVSIPLNDAGFSGLTRPVMLETAEILFMVNDNGVPVDADNIVWKKAGFSAPAMSVSVNLKNRAGGGSAGAEKILWDKEAAISGSTVPAVSGQYIELQLSEWFSEGFQDAAWGLQIYTDNSIAVSSHSYAAVTTSTVSGLVSAGSGNFLIPMFWRASDRIFADSGNIYADNEFYAEWSGMRDITAEAEAGSGISYYDRSEDIRFLDRRGFKRARLDGQGRPGYGNVPPDGKIYIYFAADFSKAKRGYLYKNDTITMELFYE